MPRVAAGPAALIAVAALTACGATPRTRVSDYIRSADAILARSAPASRAANVAYADLSAGKLPAANAASQLAGAQRSIAQLRARLAALAAPAPAQRLRRLLLKVFADDQQLASETTQLARYTPALAAALRPVSTINNRLSRRLRVSRTPLAQAAVLEDYARSLAGPLARLGHLRAPPVLLASQLAEQRRLRSIRALARQLAAAIRARDTRTTARLLQRFRAVNSSQAGPAPAARGIRAYDRRLQGLAADTALMQRELARLDAAVH